MKCKKIKEHLVAYLDKEIQADLKDEIESHLLDCPYCQAELATFKRIWSLMDEYTVTEPPAGEAGTSDFEQRLQERLRTARTQIIRREENPLAVEQPINEPFGRRRIYAVATAAVAVVLLGFILAVINQNGNHKQPANPSATELSNISAELPFLKNIDILELAEAQTIIYVNDIIELEIQYNQSDDKYADTFNLEEKQKYFDALPTERHKHLQNKFDQLSPAVKEQFNNAQLKLNRIPLTERYFISPAVMIFEKLPEAEQNRIKVLSPAERQKALFLVLENELLKYYQLKPSERVTFKKLADSEKWLKIRYWLWEESSNSEGSQIRSKSEILREKSRKLRERRGGK